MLVADSVLGVRAPAAGTMIEVLVTPGTSVAQDDELLILESMKREIPVQSPLLARLRR